VIDGNQMLVDVRHVTKTFSATAPAVTALADATLQVNAGDFVAVCGPSGCGKSTLLLTLGGLLRPDQGEVIVDGTDIYGLSTNQRARFRARTIGFVFQQFYLIPYLSVIENVLAARLGLTNGNHRAARERAETLVKRLGLLDRLNHRPGQLSTGERQRTALARAMLNQPRLLLADEPTGNLDRVNADIVLNQLVEFAQHGGAVLLVTHDAQSAARADRILRLESGRFSS
jgi:ABC-type lipoprotein export system ATPase subunit